MPDAISDPLPPPRADPNGRAYWSAVRHALSWRRYAFAAAIAAVLSTQVLFQPDLLALWSPTDIARAVAGYALELAFIGACLQAAFALVDHGSLRGRVARGAAFVVAEAAASLTAVLLVGAIEAAPDLHDIPFDVALAESLRWSLLAVFMTAVFQVHRSTVATRRAAARLEEAHESLCRVQLGMQLQLLQAQIEPHFLFNTLANLRRLYRTQPQAGAQMVDSLLRYLRAALPRMRHETATLGEELELVRAYLDLVRIRMGSRLRYTLRADPSLAALPFPPMLLMTLVENAVKHGLDPAAEGGSIEVDARQGDEAVEVSVADDGVGIGGADSSGTGVGLVNIRRQLALRYGQSAALALTGRVPRGVVCTLRIPHRVAAAPAGGMSPLAAAAG